MTHHILKSQLNQFAEVWRGNKVADLRNADRRFEAGDTACLREYDHITGAYSGREVEALITHVISHENQCALSRQAIAPEYCILSYQIVL